MTVTEAFERLASIAALPDEKIDLARAALVIARAEYPDLDEERYLRRLDELAEDARETVAARQGVEERIAALSHALYAERGFRGNESEYYDPRNSFLNDVLDRRTGIPITLALVYCEVARRLGLAMAGVGFPGHFLLKYAGTREIVVDPFSGRILDADDCRRLLAIAAGADRDVEPWMLRPARPREVLTRMLRNLKLAWLRRDEPGKALAAVERILLFVPDDPVELRDRGFLYLRLDCFAAALRDFERFLEIAPDDEAASRIRAALPDLLRQVSRLQ